jgi:hypothetical protein
MPWLVIDAVISHRIIKLEWIRLPALQMFYITQIIPNKRLSSSRGNPGTIDFVNTMEFRLFENTGEPCFKIGLAR